jgi:hypothetical protein
MLPYLLKKKNSKDGFTSRVFGGLQLTLKQMFRKNAEKISVQCSQKIGRIQTKKLWIKHNIWYELVSWYVSMLNERKLLSCS